MRLKSLFAALFAAGLIATPVWASDLQMAVAEDYPYLFTLYKHLHSHPELSFREVETAKRIGDELELLGFDVTRDFGGTGLVAVMKNGEGPTLLIRADMDALPVKEQTGVPYASTVMSTEQTGQEVSVMHACGHDIHMSVLVGTARRLKALHETWSGTLVMIGQPAEERGAGARMMLEAGLFEKFPRPDYNLALHVSPTLEAGKFGFVSGYGFANVDSVDIYVKGIGGHGAYPHMAKDPIVLGAQIIMALQTLVSREISALEAAVVTVGAFHAGAKHNVISDTAHLQITVRSYKDEIRQQLLEGIRRIAEGQARSFGMPETHMPEVKVKEAYTPALYNHPDLTDRMKAAIGNEIGEQNVVDMEPVMGGEDFARYGRVEPKIPSQMMRLGAVHSDVIKAANEGGPALPSIHSSRFAPEPEPTIKTGVASMTAAALDILGKKSQ
jgi:hippurate hydrolase